MRTSDASVMKVGYCGNILPVVSTLTPHTPVLALTLLFGEMFSESILHGFEYRCPFLLVLDLTVTLLPQPLMYSVICLKEKPYRFICPCNISIGILSSSFPFLVQSFFLISVRVITARTGLRGGCWQFKVCGVVKLSTLRSCKTFSWLPQFLLSLFQL